MTTHKELKLQLLAALATAVDGPLQAAGFSRRKGATTYSRTLGECHQSIAFVMETHPSYQPGADAHIHPMLQIALPRVSEAALALVKGDKLLLANAPEIIVNQPIDITAPKSNHERWFATGEPQFATACQAIVAFLSRWTLPFLADITSPADLVRIHETNDERMLKQRYGYVFVAAAYQLLGRPGDAAEVARQHFGDAGPRKRYAALFESLASPGTP